MSNPVIAEVTRGGIVESRHSGSYAVVDHTGRLVASGGDAAQVTFPRSAIKAFQCLPVLESGAADRFGLTGEEIALCCSSHDGEAEHVVVALEVDDQLALAGGLVVAKADRDLGHVVPRRLLRLPRLLPPGLHLSHRLHPPRPTPWVDRSQLQS